jgi:hypothetical protein
MRCENDLEFRVGKKDHSPFEKRLAVIDPLAAAGLTGNHSVVLKQRVVFAVVLSCADGVNPLPSCAWAISPC